MHFCKLSEVCSEQKLTMFMTSATIIPKWVQMLILSNEWIDMEYFPKQLGTAGMGHQCLLDSAVAELNIIL